MKHLRSLIVTGLPEIGIMVLSMVQVYLITRGWGVAVLGQVAILVAICVIAQALGFPNTREAVMRFYRRARDAGRDAEANFICLIASLGDLILIVVVSSLLWLAWYGFGLGEGRGAGLGQELAVFFAAHLVLQLRGPFLAIGYAEGRIGITALTGFVEAFGRVAVLGGVLMLTETPQLVHVALAYLVGSALSVVVILARTADLLLAARPEGSWPILREYAHFSGTTYISGAFKAGRGRIDVLMLSAFTTAEGVGIYEALKKFSAPLNFLIRPLQIMFSRDLISATDAHKVGRLDGLFLKAGGIVVASAVPFIVLFYVAAEWIFAQFEIPYGSSAMISVGLIFINQVLTQLLWWGRSFGLMVSPGTVISWNALSTAGVIVLPWLLLSYSGMEQLPALCLGMLLGTAPSIIMPVLLYLRFRKRKSAPAANG